ncbi:MAG: saccharopine dehydrogenase C-terminal domain-containing protein [Anaerolineae bacterium]|jgi:saccharopine dehydrogenase-like NADP-dependent oxidoreductase
MRILALGGAGAVAKESTRDLVAFSDFDEIVIADHDIETAETLVTAIGDPRLKVIHFDANDYDAMLHTFPKFDVVMNGLPFKYDLPVNKACVAVGVPGCDLSSDDPQFALHDEAVRKGITFVPGMGATPGITNMMVRRAIEILDQVETVDIYFAAFRCLAPAPGLLTTTLWEFDPHTQERPTTYYQDGKWHPTTPMSGGRRIRFHEQIGEQMVYYVPHDESYTLPESIPGLKRASVRGCFPPHVMRLMGALMKAGLLSDLPVRIGNQEMTTFDACRELLWAAPSSRENPVWAYGLVVEVTGARNGRRAVCTYRNDHPPQEEWGGESAYFKNVGIPLSIGAQMIAHGQAEKKGVVPPELAFSAQPFFAELAKRQIQVHEEIIETGALL